MRVEVGRAVMIMPWKNKEAFSLWVTHWDGGKYAGSSGAALFMAVVLDDTYFFRHSEPGKEQGSLAGGGRRVR